MPSTELLFKALADATRLRILRALSLEELSVTELVEVLGQPQSTVSRHLKILRDAGLLVERRNGATVLHSTRSSLSIAANSGHADQVVVEGNGLGGPANSGTAANLKDQLLAWVGHQSVEPELRERLDAVMRLRRGGRSDFFDTVGSRWDQLRIEAFGEAFHLEALTWLLPGDWAVADVGTGTGYLLPLLSSRFRQVIAVDPSEAMLQTARSRRELREASNVEFRAGSLDRLPVDDSSLDLAIASLVLHHVAEPPTALAELRRCLRAGSKLLIIEQEPHASAEFRERMGDVWWGFEPATLAEATRNAGFEEVEVRPLTTVRSANRRGMETPRLFAMVAR